MPATDPKRNALKHVRVEDRGYIDADGLPSKCLIWTGALDKNGYGLLKVKGKMVRALHLFKGHPPDDQTSDHLCRQVDCVRPTHLEFVTREENVKRSHIANPRTGAPSEKKEIGRKHHLTEEEIANIRRGLVSGIKPSVLAHKYNRDIRTINNIKNGVTWAE